jgi:hypothetical protein
MKHSSQGISPQLAIIVVAVILVSAGALAFVQRGNDANDTTNTVVNTNTEVIVNTSEDANFNANAVANTNTSKNTNDANSNTNSGGGTILSVSDAIEGGARYDGTRLCITGWYQNSFEFTALSEKAATPPYIWVEISVPESSLSCTKNSVGQETCQGTITGCGTFQYAAPDEKGFGHVNAYRYKLEPTTTSTNVNTNLNVTAN